MIQTKQKNDSTIAYDKDYYIEWYAETPIEITEAFYGNVKAGDISYEIYTRYYYNVNKENLKIDVKKEIKALEDSKATNDSIIEMLSEADKKLVTDAIKQYGAK